MNLKLVAATAFAMTLFGCAATPQNTDLGVLTEANKMGGAKGVGTAMGADAVLQAAGVRNAVNNAVSGGDRYRFCLFGCEEAKKMDAEAGRQ